MGKADALSRRAGHERGEKDNENVILLKEGHFRVQGWGDGDTEVEEEIEKVLEKTEEKIKKATKNKEKGFSSYISKNKKQLFTCENRLYLPKDSTI